jgi:hypothetical protein
VTRPWDDRFADAERYEETRRPFVFPHDRVHETEAGERSGRPSSAGARGVMSWLREPDDRHRFAVAHRYDEAPQAYVAPRGRRPLSEVREPTRRFSSADGGGVMRWLMEPGDRF